VSFAHGVDATVDDASVAAERDAAHRRAGPPEATASAASPMPPAALSTDRLESSGSAIGLLWRAGRPAATGRVPTLRWLGRDVAAPVFSAGSL